MRLSFLFLAFFLSGCFPTQQVESKILIEEQFKIGKLSFTFVGGVRIPGKTYGASRAAFVPGAFAVSSHLTLGKNAELWLAGRAKDMAIAQFAIPEVVSTKNIESMPFAIPKQPFFSISPTSKNIRVDRITGLELVDSSLFINVAKYYDANGSVPHTSRVIYDALDMSTSKVSSFFTLAGQHHAAGWMSPVPSSLQLKLGGDYLSGFADNLPIASRASIGPSLFTWDKLDFANAGFARSSPPTVISTNAIIDFSITSPLHKDRYNKSGENNLWTVESKAVFGFVPAGGNKYVVLGSSGGHTSGLGYKITQKDGARCGGPCAYDPSDYYNYYWIFEILDTETPGGQPKYQLSDFGKLNVDTYGQLISGADYDPLSKKLYLLINNADTLQNDYESKPIILVYQLDDQE